MRKPLRRLYLLYHELRLAGSRYSYVMDTELFAKHADLFLELRKKDSGLWPEITFDDGHTSNLEFAAPILHARGLTARFFITAGWTGTKPGYMGWDELRALHAAGQSIGAHGWSHTLLTHCSAKELEIELGQARKTLEDKLGTSITTMSLPGGRYNGRVLAACAEAGYMEIYTSIPRSEVLPPGSTVGRFNVLGDMQPEWMEKLLDLESGVLEGIGRKDRMKAAAKTVLGDRLYAKLWGLVNRQETDDEGHTG